MAHQNLAFDTFQSIDNSHSPFVVSNPNAYNNYTGNVSPPYARSSSSYHSNWGSSGSHGFDTSAQPRSITSTIQRPSQTSAYVGGQYNPSTGDLSSTPYNLPATQRTHLGHQSVGPNHRPRSHDTVYSILPSLEIPNQSPNSEPPRVGSGVSWNHHRRENPHQRADFPAGNFGWSPLSPDTSFVSLDPSWSDSVSSASSPDMSNSHTYSLEVSSVSPQPRSVTGLAMRQVSPMSAGSSSPPDSRRPSIDGTASSSKSCSHCHATSTPLWRREPNSLKPLCNACGLYLAQRNKHRPQELIDADAAEDSDVSDNDGVGPECSHCHTHHTSVWRRSKTGAQLCNACGVYSRLRGKERPLSLKRNKIKPRSKHTPPTPLSPL